MRRWRPAGVQRERRPPKQPAPAPARQRAARLLAHRGGTHRRQVEPTDLAALTAELASTFRSPIDKAGLRLTVECPPLSDPVSVDRGMWEKIVLNLLSNAFKFTFEGRDARGSRVGGEHVVLRSPTPASASPTGPAAMFERFHRVRLVRARTHEGPASAWRWSGSWRASTAARRRHDSGSRGHHVYRHHPHRDEASACGADRGGGASGFDQRGREPVRRPGTAWMAARMDRLHLTDSVVGLGEEVLDGGRGPRVRILLADDNADMRGYLARMLGHIYRVETVADGVEALASIRATPPISCSRT